MVPGPSPGLPRVFPLCPSMVCQVKKALVASPWWAWNRVQNHSAPGGVCISCCCGFQSLVTVSGCLDLLLHWSELSPGARCGQRTTARRALTLQTTRAPPWGLHGEKTLAQTWGLNFPGRSGQIVAYFHKYWTDAVVADVSGETSE